MLARGSTPEREGIVVYKPRRGERPLWDFESGTLCRRERAAYVVSERLGWDLVPPTVLRDGPAGFGAVQLFIDEDEEADVRQVGVTHPEQLQQMAAFDALINNADRKAGHLLIDVAGKLWGIDHGVSFHEDPKLRTVLWLYEGEPIPQRLLDDLSRFDPGVVADLLAAEELDAMCRRIATLVRTGRYPSPDPGRHHVPWPPW